VVDAYTSFASMTGIVKKEISAAVNSGKSGVLLVTDKYLSQPNIEWVS